MIGAMRGPPRRKTDSDVTRMLAYKHEKLRDNALRKNLAQEAARRRVAELERERMRKLEAKLAGHEIRVAEMDKMRRHQMAQVKDRVRKQERAWLQTHASPFGASDPTRNSYITGGLSTAIELSIRLKSKAKQVRKRRASVDRGGASKMHGFKGDTDSSGLSAASGRDSGASPRDMAPGLRSAPARSLSGSADVDTFRAGESDGGLEQVSAPRHQPLFPGLRTPSSGTRPRNGTRGASKRPASRLSPVLEGQEFLSSPLDEFPFACSNFPVSTAATSSSASFSTSFTSGFAADRTRQAVGFAVSGGAFERQSRGTVRGPGDYLPPSTAVATGHRPKVMQQVFQTARSHSLDKANAPSLPTLPVHGAGSAPLSPASAAMGRVSQMSSASSMDSSTLTYLGSTPTPSPEKQPVRWSGPRALGSSVLPRGMDSAEGGPMPDFSPKVVRRYTSVPMPATARQAHAKRLAESQSPRAPVPHAADGGDGHAGSAPDAPPSSRSTGGGSTSRMSRVGPGSGSPGPAGGSVMFTSPRAPVIRMNQTFRYSFDYSAPVRAVDGPTAPPSATPVTSLPQVGARRSRTRIYVS